MIHSHLRIAAAAALAWLFPGGAVLHGQQEKFTAEEILGFVRYSQTANRLQTKGTLRQGRERHRFDLFLDGPSIQFVFAKPAQSVRLDLGDAACRLLESREGGSEKEVPAARYGEAIRETDVTYEDLALRFLYWPRPELLGEAVVRPERITWKIRVVNPGRSGPYGQALVWVDKVSGALLQVHGFDRSGALVKRFQVISGQRMEVPSSEGKEKIWMLKELRVETVDPRTGNRVGEYTYLNLDKPKG